MVIYDELSLPEGHVLKCNGVLAVREEVHAVHSAGRATCH